ncbi:MAG: CAP domain-containing protein [Pyrinomonadaceae bacterium]
MANHLLNQVNIERAEARVSPLKLDRLACTVAEKHATEMARNNFLSHWGLDGRKPYHRYSFAGGVEAIQENGGAINTTTPIASAEVPIHLMQMHRSMHDEVAPADGHRKTILNPIHTHVGFGYADYGFCVRLCELYVARYVAIDPYAVTASPRDRILLSGRLLEPTYSLESIDVFYEPLPSPPDRDWLRVPRPYGLPDERETLLPKLGSTYFYEDGSKGSIEVQGRGRFQAPILLSRKEPGIYTAVVWISRSPKETPFPATQVCVRAE